MSQPDNYGFGEEAALLKASARRFLGEYFPTAKLHAMVAADPDPERMSDAHFERALWQQMVDLGWMSLAVPEEAGGVGMPLVAVAGLVEEVGRAEIAEGRAATLAITGADGDWQGATADILYEDGRLSGSAWFVQDARKVERFLVSARNGSGLGLFWVAADAPGVTVGADAIVDLTRDQAHVSFDGAPAQLLCDDAASALDQAMPAIHTLLAADIAGAAEWQLQTSVEYVGTRQQFDRPLGFFQAVKHPLVDVMIQVDQTRSLVFNAACAFDTEPERAAAYAHMAKASASETAAFASGRSVQYHGGIGFTWECYLHLYFKRQKHSQMLWGDAAWHRARLADLLMGSAA